MADDEEEEELRELKPVNIEADLETDLEEVHSTNLREPHFLAKAITGARGAYRDVKSRVDDFSEEQETKMEARTEQRMEKVEKKIRIKEKEHRLRRLEDKERRYTREAKARPRTPLFGNTAINPLYDISHNSNRGHASYGTGNEPIGRGPTHELGTGRHRKEQTRTPFLLSVLNGGSSKGSATRKALAEGAGGFRSLEYGSGTLRGALGISGKKLTARKPTPKRRRKK